MSIIIIIISLIVLILILFYRRLKQMSILGRNGIPGPKPHLIFGHLFQMRGLSMIEKQKFLIEKYGKIVGYYTGARPNVLIADLELVKNIQIKHFHNFTDRSIYMRYQHPSQRTDGALIIVKGKRWKQIRSLLSPAFSSAKLKKMIPLLDDSIKTFLQKVNQKSKSEEGFDIYELYKRLTAEMIIKTSFGVEIDAQNDPNNRYVRAVNDYMKQKVNKFIFLLVNCIPELYSLVHPFRRLYDNIGLTFNLTPIGILYEMIGHIIRYRKQSNSHQREDVLQGMLDSRVSNEDMSAISYENLKESIHENRDLSTNGSQNFITNVSNKNEFHLNEDEIISNSIVFYGAGYETSSSGLGYCTHLLVNYPEIQEKLRNEIQNLYEREGKLDYNTVTQLEYLEWVFNEAMRLYPPVTTGATRECLADYHYKHITIPKGAIVVISTYYLHYDPNNWSDPEKCDPMRYSPERRHEIKPSSWQPFGDGPRNCIGMRLAYLQMKLCLAQLLLAYRLECVPQTEIGKLDTKVKLLSTVPKNGVFVKAVKL